MRGHGQGQVGRKGAGGSFADVSGSPARHGGGGDLGQSLRENVPARSSVSACRGQRAVAGAGAGVGRMPVPHRLCAPVPQPPGPVCHAGGRPQPGAAAGRSSTSAKPSNAPFPSPSLASWLQCIPTGRAARFSLLMAPFPRQVDVWGAQAGLVVAGYYHANAALNDQR